MKAGEIFEFEVEKFIAQNEYNSCTGCYFNNGHCNEVKGIDCYADKIILIKISLELIEKIEQLEKQIELMKNCDNCKYQATRYNEKADNALLEFLDRNNYKCVRSNKKAIQEYKCW